MKGFSCNTSLSSHHFFYFYFLTFTLLVHITFFKLIFEIQSCHFSTFNLSYWIVLLQIQYHRIATNLNLRRDENLGEYEKEKKKINKMYEKIKSGMYCLCEKWITKERVELWILFSQNLRNFVKPNVSAGLVGASSNSSMKFFKIFYKLDTLKYI